MPFVRFRVHLARVARLVRVLFLLGLRGAFLSNRSQRPRHRKRNHPRPSFLETTRLNEVKASLHDGTARYETLTADVRVDEVREEDVQVLQALLHVVRRGSSSNTRREEGFKPR